MDVDFSKINKMCSEASLSSPPPCKLIYGGEYHILVYWSQGI